MTELECQERDAYETIEKLRQGNKLLSENLQYSQKSFDTKVQEVEEIKGQYQKEMEIFKHDLQAEVLKKEYLELEKEALLQQIEQSAKVVENQKEEIENKAIEVRNRISQHETSARGGPPTPTENLKLVLSRNSQTSYSRRNDNNTSDTGKKDKPDDCKTQ